MSPCPDWKELADAVLKVWNGMGWAAMALGAVVVLVWKFIDSWGKKAK